MASNELTDLDYIRIAKERGLLEKLSPSQRAIIAKRLEVPMQEEREEALKTQAELAVTPPKTSFMQDLVSGFQAIKENPGAAVHNAVRGVERSFNPLPVANLINKANPFSDGDIPDDLETMESALNFPIIRGAELAARMFVPKDQRPSLTTFAQVVNNQREMDQQLRSITPGVQEGAELGSVAISTAQLASSGLKAAVALSKRAPEGMRSVAQKTYQALADKKKSQATKLSGKILKVQDGPLLDSILSRPERIEQVLKENNDLTIVDIGVKLKDELESIGHELGKRVSAFRGEAYSDNATRIKLPAELAENLRVLKGKTTFAPTAQVGKGQASLSGLSSASPDELNLLPGDISKRLDASIRAAELGVVTPRQAMIWVDMLDDIIDFQNAPKAGSNVIKSSQNTLMAARGQIKDALRNSLAGQQWVEADNNFSGFINASDGLIRRLDSDSSESLIANLFGKNKTPLRSRIEVALDHAELIDPTAKGQGSAFFDRLSDIKAAQRVKDVQYEVTDPIQDNVHRIVSEWRKRGENLGRITGAASGYIGGKVFGDATPFAQGGSSISGYLAGKTIGGWAGTKVGEKLADPMRIIELAKQSKQLSAEAKKLASDMGYIVQKTGPQGAIAFLDLVGPIPAVNQLLKFANSREIKEQPSNKGGQK